MFETVIWASDGSETADRALPYAKALAEGPGRRLVAFHCDEILTGRSGGWPVLADEDEVLAKLRQQVEELRSEGIDAALEVATSPAPGAAHELVRLAGEIGADAIVVGTRGRSSVSGLLLGSLTHRLLHVAPCPVLAVPPRDGATAE